MNRPGSRCSASPGTGPNPQSHIIEVPQLALRPECGLSPHVPRGCRSPGEMGRSLHLADERPPIRSGLIPRSPRLREHLVDRMIGSAHDHGDA